MGLTTQRRGPKFIFVQRSGTYTYMEAQKVFNEYLQRNVQWYGTYTLRDAQNFFKYRYKGIYKRWGLQLKEKPKGFWKVFFLKRDGTYTYMEAQKFLRYEKGYGTYTHMEAQVFLKIEIETSCNL